MKTLNIGTWLEKNEVDLIKKELIDEFGDENVSCEDKAQYLGSVLSFSTMRGLSKKDLIKAAEFALWK